ncbi:hypothetical protein [Massilia sp. CCM 8734]|nr:hypothetical protein [Massilia sp. CCM 8734]
MSGQRFLEVRAIDLVGRVAGWPLAKVPSLVLPGVSPASIDITITIAVIA